MATPQGDLLDSDWQTATTWVPRHAMNEKSTTTIITRCAVTVAGSKISTVEPAMHPACIPETHTDMTIEIAEVIYTAICHECTQAQATTGPHETA